MLEHQIKNERLIVVLKDHRTNNALSLRKVKRIMELINEHKPRALLVSGRGRVFCSGGQLKEYAKMESKEQGLDVNKAIRDQLNELANLPIAKVAIADGFCFGGGVEFLSCFNHVISSPRSLFGLWHRKIGLSFGWGGKDRLEKMIGPHALKSWYVSGALITSYRAQQMGLVHHITHHTRAILQAKFWIKEALELSQNALKVASKPGLTEEEVFAELWMSDDHRAALDPYRT